MPAESPSRANLKAFLNSECGNAEAARGALDKVGFDLEVVKPAELEAHLRKAIDGGARRILVAGGGGTIATAAALVAERGGQLGALPSGKAQPLCPRPHNPHHPGGTGPLPP